MSDWMDSFDDKNSKFISCKEGETATFVIKEIRRITTQPKFDPKSKDGTPQGWHLEVFDTDGKRLSVSSYALQSLFRDAGRKDRDNPRGPLVGRTLTIRHLARGEYEMVLGKAGVVVEKEEDEPPF